MTDECGNVIWANYEWAWGGSYAKHYNTQYLNNIEIKDYELQPLKFQGQSLDIETGLHYNRFRYYDSDVGMFIQRDPIGLLGGVNVFQYAPNPIHWIDPLGLDVHHIIPNAVYRDFRVQFKGLSDGNGNRYVQNRNRKAKDKSNLLDLGNLTDSNGRPFHANHPAYNDYVRKELDFLKDKNMFTLDNIKKLQSELIDEIERAKSQFKLTGKNLNDYFKDLNENSNKGKNLCNT